MDDIRKEDEIPTVGLRVMVWSPDRKEYLGEAVIEKVEPFFVEGIGKTTDSYPSVIRFDDGRITEGLKCWWARVSN